MPHLDNNKAFLNISINLNNFGELIEQVLESINLDDCNNHFKGQPEDLRNLAVLIEDKLDKRIFDVFNKKWSFPDWLKKTVADLNKTDDPVWLEAKQHYKI